MTTTTRSVPLVDLGWQHREIEGEVLEGWNEVLANTSFILGPQVEAFEREFAEFCEVGHCVGVGSGTDALELALRALDVGPGDEVVLPANTFIATALAVSRLGARPVLVDSDKAHLMSVERLKEVVSSRTKAIIPVHLYGQMAPVAEIRQEFPHIPVVEDGAQSQGARRSGRRSGSVGHISATSFYPGKNIGAYGDGGAVLTDSDDLAGRVRKLRNWGSEIKYHHPEMGFNSRLDTLQAAVLTAKLKRLDAWNALRQVAAGIYHELLADSQIGLPVVGDSNEHVWHLYVIEVEERDRVLEHLNSMGVGAGIHYPVPVHLQGAYEHLGYGPGAFPNAEAASHRILSLPMYPGITESDQEYVVDCLKQALGHPA